MTGFATIRVMARPRSTEAHRAALDATVEVLLEGGVEGVTLEAIAARSGVAKSTLYRHFGSKEALVVQAARGCLVEHPTPDTGSLAGDLRYLFDRWGEAEERKRIPELLPMLLDLATREPAMHDVVEAVLEERRRPMRTILQLAQLRGEIAPDLDPEMLLAIIIGPFTYRRTVDRLEITEEFAELVLQSALAALHATTAPAASEGPAPAADPTSTSAEPTPAR